MLSNKFILRATEIHNAKYCYKLDTETILVKDKVTAICDSHGEFQTRVHDHIYHKSGCPECARLKKSNINNFVNKAQTIHNNRYDYSLVSYVNNYTSINIICEQHGVFKQVPHIHLSAKIGCPKCEIDLRTNSLKDFIDIANEKHGNFYNYDLVIYNGSKEKVKIKCPEHGIFLQSPNNHIYKNSGCPICANFKRTKTINNTKRAIDGNGIIYVAQFEKNNEQFIKVGITTGDGVITRFGKTHLGYSVIPLLERNITMKQATKIENKVLDYFNTNRYNPKIKFGGYTECLNIAVKEKILKYINRRIL